MQDPIIVDQTPARPPRRTYSNEFKADAVAQCERGDRSLAQVAMDLKINANLVRRWQKERQGQTKGQSCCQFSWLNLAPSRLVLPISKCSLVLLQSRFSVMSIATTLLTWFALFDDNTASTFSDLVGRWRY